MKTLFVVNVGFVHPSLTRGFFIKDPLSFVLSSSEGDWTMFLKIFSGELDDRRPDIADLFSFNGSRPFFLISTCKPRRRRSSKIPRTTGATCLSSLGGRDGFGGSTPRTTTISLDARATVGAMILIFWPPFFLLVRAHLRSEQYVRGGLAFAMLLPIAGRSRVFLRQNFSMHRLAFLLDGANDTSLLLSCNTVLRERCSLHRPVRFPGGKRPSLGTHFLWATSRPYHNFHFLSSSKLTISKQYFFLES